MTNPLLILLAACLSAGGLSLALFAVACLAKFLNDMQADARSEEAAAVDGGAISVTCASATRALALNAWRGTEFPGSEQSGIRQNARQVQILSRVANSGGKNETLNEETSRRSVHSGAGIQGGGQA